MSDSVMGSLNASLAEKMAGKFDPALESTIRAWLATRILEPERVQARRPLQELLKDGTILCEMMNSLLPQDTIRYNSSSLPFKQMENISKYVALCERLGLTEHERFQTLDLYENKDFVCVMNHLRVVKLLAEKHQNDLSALLDSQTSGSRRASAGLSPNPATRKLKRSSLSPAASPAPAKRWGSIGASPSTSAVVTTDHLPPSVSSLHADISTKEEFKYSPELEQGAKKWIRALLDDESLFTGQSLAATLQSGVVLCRCINAIQPNTIPKISTSSFNYAQMENIGKFLAACLTLGLQKTDIFDTPDLWDKKNLNLVINTIHILARFVAEKLPGYTGPKIDDSSQVRTLFSSALSGKQLDSILGEEEAREMEGEEREMVEWLNSQLAKRDPTLCVPHLSCKGVRTALTLIHLMEILTKTESLGFYESDPQVLWHCMQNASLVLRVVYQQTFVEPECKAQQIVLGQVPPLLDLLRLLRDKFDVDWLFLKALNEGAETKLSLDDMEGTDQEDRATQDTQAEAERLAEIDARLAEIERALSKEQKHLRDDKDKEKDKSGTSVAGSSSSTGSSSRHKKRHAIRAQLRKADSSSSLAGSGGSGVPSSLPLSEVHASDGATSVDGGGSMSARVAMTSPSHKGKGHHHHHHRHHHASSSSSTTSPRKKDDDKDKEKEKEKEKGATKDSSSPSTQPVVPKTQPQGQGQGQGGKVSSPLRKDVPAKARMNPFDKLLANITATGLKEPYKKTPPSSPHPPSSPQAPPDGPLASPTPKEEEEEDKTPSSLPQLEDPTLPPAEEESFPPDVAPPPPTPTEEESRSNPSREETNKNPTDDTASPAKVQEGVDLPVPTSPAPSPPHTPTSPPPASPLPTGTLTTTGEASDDSGATSTDEDEGDGDEEYSESESSTLTSSTEDDDTESSYTSTESESYSSSASSSTDADAPPTTTIPSTTTSSTTQVSSPITEREKQQQLQELEKQHGLGAIESRRAQRMEERKARIKKLHQDQQAALRAKELQIKQQAEKAAQASKAQALINEEEKKERVLKAQAIVRKKVATELLQTERNYVKSLETVVEGLVRPARQGQLLSKEESKAIFANLDELVAKHHALLRMFEQRIDQQWEDSSTIGDLFLQHMDVFVQYRQYLVNYNISIVVLQTTKQSNERFKQLVNKFQRIQMKTSRLSVESFLIMPVQRIPRYLLLMADIKKYTNPAHRDGQLLGQAISALQATLHAHNEGIDPMASQYAQKLLAIAGSIQNVEDIPTSITKGSLVRSGRRFVAEGKVRTTITREGEGSQSPLGMRAKVKAKVKAAHHFCFLLNDVVLLCHENPKNAEHPFIFVQATGMAQAAFERADKRTVLVKLPSGEMWRVRCSTSTLADDWMKAVPTATTG